MDKTFQDWLWGSTKSKFVGDMLCNTTRARNTKSAFEIINDLFRTKNVFYIFDSL